jgi:glutamyl-tRNA synthetase
MMTEKRVRVRYAPSPTGFQHVGGVRTALFDYLFARAMGGDFVLRIEDTDRTRYVDGALEDIYKTFEWLGIDFDEGPGKGGPCGPYIQSERREIYRRCAEVLLESDRAYLCFCDEGRLEELRGHADDGTQRHGYDRRCRYLTDTQRQELRRKKPNPVVRMKIPLEGFTSFRDGVFGTINFENKMLQDLILMKSDGFPTYHLANVVDDHLMEITHVLRGQEWLPSTAIHILLFDAFGWSAPEYCHLPLIMGEDGHKLSKRHGATRAIEFKSQGYLPEAFINYITLLGWSYNDRDEVFSIDELIKIFDISRINKSPATFDYSKLKWLNGTYIRMCSHERLLNLLLPYYAGKGLISSRQLPEEIEYVSKLLPLVRERIEVLTEAPTVSDFMFGEYPEYRAWDMIVPGNVERETIVAILRDAEGILQELGKKCDAELERELHALKDRYHVKAGVVFMALRIAVTGTNKSPELFAVINILGKERTVKRIARAIEKI